MQNNIRNKIEFVIFAVFVAAWAAQAGDNKCSLAPQHAGVHQHPSKASGVGMACVTQCMLDQLGQPRTESERCVSGSDNISQLEQQTPDCLYLRHCFPNDQEHLLTCLDLFIAASLEICTRTMHSSALQRIMCLCCCSSDCNAVLVCCPAGS